MNYYHYSICINDLLDNENNTTSFEVCTLWVSS